jgi:hypothetical protein
MFEKVSLSPLSVNWGCLNQLWSPETMRSIEKTIIFDLRSLVYNSFFCNEFDHKKSMVHDGQTCTSRAVHSCRPSWKPISTQQKCYADPSAIISQHLQMK